MAESALDYEKIVSYRTRGDQYYLILGSMEQTALPYQVNMIRYNQIGCLLPMQFFIEDGLYQYYYDISGMRSLVQELSVKKLKWTQIQQLLNQLYQTISRMEDFLLELDGIILLPEYIYWNQESKNYWFCYYPDKKEGFDKSLGELLEFFLNHLDYSDDDSVKRTYDVYQKLRKGHIPLAQVVHSFDVLEGTESYDESVNQYSFREDNNLHSPLYENQRDTFSHGSDDSEEESEDEADSVFKVRLNTLLPYVSDLVGGLLVARMAYYLFKNHNSMTGNQFLIWVGGMLLVIGACAFFSTCFGKILDKQELTEDPLSRETTYDNLQYNNSTYEKSTSDYNLVKRRIVTAFSDQDYDQNRVSNKSCDREERGDYQDNLYQRKGYQDKDYKSRNSTVYEKPAEYGAIDFFEERVFSDKENVNGEKDAISKIKADKGNDMIPKTMVCMEHDVIPKTVIMRSKESEMERFSALIPVDQEKIQPILLNQENMVIGKVRGFVDVYLNDQCISRVHAQIQKGEDGCSIKDLGSTNGTFVNGRKLQEQERVVLHQGDEVTFADVSFQFLQDFS